METRTFVIGNGTLVLEDSLLENGSVHVEDGVISEITREPHRHKGVPFIDAKGGFIAPGLTELHIHGCGEYSFESIDASGLRAASRFLKEHGITQFVPTIQASETSLFNLAEIIGDTGDENAFPSVPGLYVEGPFVNPEKRGGILEEFCSPPDLEYLYELLDRSGYLIKLMTVAPELEGFDTLLQPLVRMGVVPCLGHSMSTVRQTEKLRMKTREAGGRINITHLFNAMSPISHKTDGLAMLPFLDEGPFVELNCDGVHVNSEAVRMCYNHLNRDRLILISDAVVTAGLSRDDPLGRGKTYYGKSVISTTDGVRYADSGVLIGSNRLLPKVMRNFMRITGAPLWEAVKFASLNPNRLLGLDDKRGTIQPGKQGDLVVLDRSFFTV